MEQLGTRCMQLSVDARRWPDEMLDGVLSQGGTPVSAADAREAMRTMADQGFTVVPCSRHECETDGRCTGRPLLPTA